MKHRHHPQEIVDFVVGTSHWVSVEAVKRAYDSGAEEAIRSGAVIIGRPKVKDDERLIHRGGRYHIEVLKGRE